MLTIYPLCFPFLFQPTSHVDALFSSMLLYMASGFGSQFEPLLIEFSTAEEFPRIHPPSRMPGKKKKQNIKLSGAALLYCRANRRLAKISCWLLSLAIKFRDSFTSLCSCCFYSSCCWHQVVLTKCTIKKRDKLWKLVFLFCIPSWKQWNQPQK